MMEFDFKENIETSPLSWGEKQSLLAFSKEPPRTIPIPKEHEPTSRILFLKKDGSHYKTRFEGRPDHFAVVNSGNLPEHVEVEAWGATLWSQEVKPGYALVEVLGEQTGLRLSTSYRSDWYPASERYHLDITLTSRCQYVGALGMLAGQSLGSGFTTRSSGPVRLSVAQDDTTYVTNSALLQVPLTSIPRRDSKADVVSAQIFEAAVESGSTDPLGSCPEEVIERVHGIYGELDTSGLDAIAVLWAIVLVKSIGALEFTIRKRSGKGFTLRGLAFGILVAAVTACTLNSECTPPNVCSFGNCVSKLPNGALCEETADCEFCPCIEIILPGLGAPMFCQCPDPTRTSTNTPTPSRTPSRSRSASVSQSRTRSLSASMTPLTLPSASTSPAVLPSGSMTPTASRTMISTPSTSGSPTGSAMPTVSSSMSALPSPSETPSSTASVTGSTTPSSTPSASTTGAVTSSTTMTSLPSATGTAQTTPSLSVQPTATSSPSVLVSFASSSASNLPTSEVKPSVSANPTSNISPSGTVMFGATSASATVLPGPTVTPTLAIAIPPAEVVDGHFEHVRDLNVTSGARTLAPSIAFILAAKAVESAVCIGTRLARTMSEVQVVGTSLNSTSGNYTYDSILYYGIEEPTMRGSVCNDSYALLPDVNVTEHRSRSLKSLELSSSPVFVYRDGSALTLRFIDEKPRAVEVNIGGNFWNFVTNNSLLYVSLPVRTFWYTVTVVVRTRVNGVLESENAFTVQGERPCVIEDCYFCNLLNWDCTPVLFRWLAVLSIILLAICVLWVAVQFSATILAVCGLGAKCSLYCGKALWNVTKNKGKAIEGWVRTNAAADISRSVVIFCAVSGVLCCDNSVVVSSDHITTVLSQGYSTSTIVTDSIISMRGFGGVVCLLYQEAGQPIATLEIKSTSNSIECDLVNPYYTSAFEIYSLSSFRCNGAGPCPDDCDAETPRDAYGEFNSTNWIAYPGETRCTRRCSGLSCGCILPATGCVYTTYSVLPKNPLARVSEVSVCARSPSFYYTLKDTQNQVVSSGEIDTVSEIGENDDFTFEILTQTPVDTPADFPTHLVQTQGTSSLVDAAKRGRPAYGMPGDIQADTKNLLASGNFTYDPRIVSRYDEKSKHDKVVTNPPGIFSLNSAKALPAVIGRAVWSTNTDSSTWATKITSYDSGDSPSLIAVRSKGSFTVTTLVNVVCPVVAFKSLVGCRECSGGAVATFTVSSKCLSGSVVVRGKGAVDGHVYMDDVEREAKVVVRSDEEDYSETWTFGDVDVEVEGHLDLAIELGQTELLYNGTEKEKAHEGFRAGHWTWWEYSLFGLACALAICGSLFVILVFAYPSLKLLALGLKVGRKAVHVVKEEVLPPKREQAKSADDLRRRILSGMR